MSYGGVPNELISNSDSSPICNAIDKEANHQIMHLDGFGKTDGLPDQAFDPCTQCGVFAFDLLRMLGDENETCSCVTHMSTIMCRTGSWRANAHEPDINQ